MAWLFQAPPLPPPGALLEAMTRQEYGLGMFSPEGFFLLTPRQRLPYEKLLGLLHREVLEGFLRAERVAYTPNAEEAVDGVRRGGDQLGFFLHPLKVGNLPSVGRGGGGPA